MANNSPQHISLDFQFTPKQALAFNSPANEIFWGGAAGGGKLLALDTKIPTPSGWKTVGALKIGEQIFGQDGKPYDILDLSPISYEPKSFELTFDNGTKIKACADHLWRTFDNAD